MISHYIFKLLNWNIYTSNSQGFHIPFMAAIVFWLPAVVISKKYPNHFGTSLSYKVGGVMLIVSMIVLIVFLLGLLYKALL